MNDFFEGILSLRDPRRAPERRLAREGEQTATAPSTPASGGARSEGLTPEEQRRRRELLLKKLRELGELPR